MFICNFKRILIFTDECFKHNASESQFRICIVMESLRTSFKATYTVNDRLVLNVVV